MAATFFKAILGGFAISIGGIIYLTLHDNHIVGALLFSIGLFTIYTFDFNLFTGKVCFIPNKKPHFLLDVGLVYLGNLVGTVGTAYILRLTKLSALIPYAEESAAKKLSDTLPSSFAMAFMCGVMMSVAVIGFMTVKDSVGKHLALVMPIMVFILAGFEHSIANLFYYSFANAWSAHAVLNSAVLAVGNLAGGMLIPLSMRLITGKKLGCEEAVHK